MTNDYHASRSRWRRAPRRRPAMLAAIAAAAILSACNTDKLLRVDDPDVAIPGSLSDPTALPALRAGARGDFQLAIGGQSSGDAQVTMSALLTDEFLNSETFPTRIEVDQRTVRVDNVTTETVFRNLSRARAAAERAARGYEKFDQQNPGYVEVLALAGYGYLHFGENYCSGVPFSVLNDDGSITFGAPQTTDQMFATAISKFDSAIAIGTAIGDAATDFVLLARVGRARALLDQGQFAEAAAEAQTVVDVDPAFTYVVQHSDNSARQENGIFSLTYLGRRFTVPDLEGGNGLPFRSDGLTDGSAPPPDPRVANARGGTAGTPAVVSRANGFDNSTPLYLALKYPDRSAPVVVASGIEAQLIVAEAALQGGAASTWLGILNGLRADVGLSPLADPGTPTAREDLHFKERAYWLYLTSHRLGDLRRLVRQYQRDPESVFPTGPYFKGGTYGPDVNLPVPIDEQNNPEARNAGLNARNCLTDDA